MMKHILRFWAKLLITILGVMVAMTALISCSEEGEKFQAPLFDNLGEYTVQATTESKDANRFFVQGLLLTYNFNHGEAARSFREAIRLDSSFAMAYWGLAYTLGPNYNASMDPEASEEVFWAVRKAHQNASNLSHWEYALIDAMRAKYVAGQSQPQLLAHSESLRKSSEDLPENADILTFYAEALMLEHPWDLYDYKGGPAKEWTPAILTALERALAINPDHPLANHLLIHATEASPNPSYGLEAAEKLPKLSPGAGHLVHMPSHTYINTGDYHFGTEVNLLAVAADSSYAAQCKAQGAFPLYYYHNYHFLAACAALEGRGSLAIEASFKMAQIIDKSLLSIPGFETTQHFMTIPYNVLVKFEQWEKILSLPKPDDEYSYLVGMWSFARGMAYANSKQEIKAGQELERLVSIQNSTELGELLIFGFNSAQEVTEIAVKVLEAELAQKNGKYSQAEKFLIDAIAIEDGLNYQEPPDWFFSVRHILGDLYLQTRAFEKAEEVYRQDLEIFPKNGFALNGLYHSLIQQEKIDEGLKLLTQFKESWKYADSKLKFSRIDPQYRNDLVVEIVPDSPPELIFFASNLCGIR